MDFNEVINNRRSARLFTDENISNKQIEKILESGCVAPSAMMNKKIILWICYLNGISLIQKKDLV